MPGSAQMIYQAWLDQTSAAVWDRDLKAVAAAMAYPHKIATSDAELTMNSPGDVLDGVQEFSKFLNRAGAQAFHRICTSAEVSPHSKNVITGTHTTYILRGGTYVIDPYSNALTLVRNGKTWLARSLHSDVENTKCTILSPAQLRARRLDKGLETQREATR